MAKFIVANSPKSLNFVSFLGFDFNNMIEVKNLNFSYPGNLKKKSFGLNNINLKISDNEFQAIVMVLVLVRDHQCV